MATGGNTFVMVSELSLTVSFKIAASDCVVWDNRYVHTIQTSPSLTVMVCSNLTWFEDILHFFCDVVQK